MIQQITRWGSCLRGTRQYWNYARKELKAITYGIECMTECLATVFFTLSPADLHWRDLHKHLPGNEAYLDKTLPHDNAVRMRKDAQQRAEALKRHPALSSWLFSERVDAFVKYVLDPLWGVRDYWWRKEYQGRGSDHVHGFLWLRDYCREDLNQTREDLRKTGLRDDEPLPPLPPQATVPAVGVLSDAIKEVLDTEANDGRPLTGDSCREIANWVASRLGLEGNHPAMYRSEWRGGEDCAVPTDNVLRQTYTQMCGVSPGSPIPSRDEMLRNLDAATCRLCDRCITHKCTNEYCRKAKVMRKKRDENQSGPAAAPKKPATTAPEAPVPPDERTDPCRFFKPNREICECLRCHPMYPPSDTCAYHAVGRRLAMDGEADDDSGGGSAISCRCVDCTGVECTCDSRECNCGADDCRCHVGTSAAIDVGRTTCWCKSKVYHRVHTEKKKDGKEKVRVLCA